MSHTVPLDAYSDPRSLLPMVDRIAHLEWLLTHARQLVGEHGGDLCACGDPPGSCEWCHLRQTVTALDAGCFFNEDVEDARVRDHQNGERS